MSKSEHQARRYQDVIMCDRCACQWDFNEPEPERCTPLPKGMKRNPNSKRITGQDFKNLKQALITNDFSKFDELR